MKHDTRIKREIREHRVLGRNRDSVSGEPDSFAGKKRERVWRLRLA